MSVPVLHATHPRGDGPLLLLGPSLGTSTILWDDAAAPLSKEFVVAAWDLPGHGLSPATREPFSVGELADAVVAIADELGAQRFLYAGDSLGGAVGLELLLRHPRRVLAASVICSAARIATPESWFERAQIARTLGTSSLVVASAQRWFAPGSVERNPVSSGRLLHALRDADDESYALCAQALAGFDVRSQLASVDAPVQVMVGEHDVVVPREDSQLVANGVPGARWVSIADAAHLVPAEQPERAAAELVTFFTEVIA